MKERTELEQLWFKHRKAYIAQIRLKHSLRAEDEINQKLAKVKLEFEKQIQRGMFPAPPNFAAALGE